MSDIAPIQSGETKPALPASQGHTGSSPWHQTLANVAVIASVFVMYAIYASGRTDALDMRKKETAAALLPLKYDSDLRASQQRVNDFIIASRQLYDRAFLAKTAGHRLALQTLSPELLADIQKITDYYTDVVACSNDGACDTGMIAMWFKEDVKGFACNVDLVGLPELRRSMGAQYGASLVAYAGGCR